MFNRKLVFRLLIGVPVALFVGSAIIVGFVGAILHPTGSPSVKQKVTATPHTAAPPAYPAPHKPARPHTSAAAAAPKHNPSPGSQRRPSKLYTLDDLAEIRDYTGQEEPILTDFEEARSIAQTQIHEFVSKPALYSDNGWRMKMGLTLGAFMSFPARQEKIHPPAIMRHSNNLIYRAIKDGAAFADDYARGIDNGDPAQLRAGNRKMLQSGALLDEATRELRQINRNISNEQKNLLGS